MCADNRSIPKQLNTGASDLPDSQYSYRENCVQDAGTQQTRMVNFVTVFQTGHRDIYLYKQGLCMGSSHDQTWEKIQAGGKYV